MARVWIVWLWGAWLWCVVLVWLHSKYKYTDGQWVPSVHAPPARTAHITPTNLSLETSGGDPGGFRRSFCAF
jgi:hypothetical protein